VRTQASPDAGSSGVIEPLATGARAGEVEQRIGQAIALGLLPHGQQLPAEVVFASELGVSPSTLRDALASLREQGLVETRRGRAGGTFVMRPAEPDEDDLWERLRRTSATALRDLADEHAAIAGMSARLAAERASAADVSRLGSLIEQLSKAEALGPRIRADSRFHVDLAAASYSERLKQREVVLQGDTGDLLWLPHRPELDPSQAVHEHSEIALAVANEDGDRARHLAELHVQSSYRRLTELHYAATKTRKGAHRGRVRTARRAGR
jgi:GntR family transcriptional regulator, transcriptional repressor for pyruvate dehydrogenase complex